MNPVTIVGVVAVAVMSITTHEAAHGYVADRLGDPTARDRGRLTLNPIPHIDLFFTILLPLFLVISGSGMIFGGAKPVPVNIGRLRNPRRDWAIVGAAGPVSNVLIAVLLTALLSIGTHTGLVSLTSSVAAILAVGIFINALLAMFNLMPIPPLDGSRIVQFFLSGNALNFYLQLERIGLLILMGLIFFVPVVHRILAIAIFGLVRIIATPFGVWNDLQMVLSRVL